VLGKSVKASHYCVCSGFSLYKFVGMNLCVRM
jgi:hypothetical protein